MTSFDVFALFYCFLSPIEQFTLHISKKYNIPNRHAAINFRWLYAQRKTEGKENYLCR